VGPWLGDSFSPPGEKVFVFVHFWANPVSPGRSISSWVAAHLFRFFVLRFSHDLNSHTLYPIPLRAGVFRESGPLSHFQPQSSPRRFIPPFRFQSAKPCCVLFPSCTQLKGFLSPFFPTQLCAISLQRCPFSFSRYLRSGLMLLCVRSFLSLMPSSRDPIPPPPLFLKIRPPLPSSVLTSLLFSLLYPSKDMMEVLPLLFFPFARTTCEILFPFCPPDQSLNSPHFPPPSYSLLLHFFSRYLHAFDRSGLSSSFPA